METILQLATSWILPGLFFWAVLSGFASAILEWLSSLLGWKAEYLEKGIGDMLGDENLSKNFFEHPLILSSTTIKKQRGKSARYRKVPQQIPSRIFAQIILDWILNVAKPGENETYTASLIKRNLLNLEKQYPDLGQSLNVMFASAGIDRLNAQVDEVLVKAQQNIQNWFDDSMEEVVRWYKRRAQVAAIFIGILLAILVNFDVIGITSQLWKNAYEGPIIQKAVEGVLSSLQLPESNSQVPLSVEEVIGGIVSKIPSINALPIGWNKTNLPRDAWAWTIKFAGLIAGGAFISIGAQYGHDLFSKKK